MDPNEQQIEFWNGEGGRRWAEHDAQFERTIGPLTAPLLARIDANAALHALDIGCGCGNQTLALARHLGPAARVTGIDISTPMLALARRRAGAVADVAPIEFLLADASVHRFEPGRAGLLFSRFGVMFFADPVAAFRNLHAACAAGARLVFCCWQAPALNDWIRLPLQAALRHVPAPAPTDPHAPGPFAFADRERVSGILEAAGFGAVQFEDLQTQLCFAEGDTLAAAADALVQAGPVNALLAPLDDARRGQALEDIRAVLAPHFRDGKMLMRSAAWLVEAQRIP
jgi:SAM-dependent methyltransferase